MKNKLMILTLALVALSNVMHANPHDWIKQWYSEVIQDNAAERLKKNTQAFLQQQNKNLEQAHRLLDMHKNIAEFQASKQDFDIKPE